MPTILIVDDRQDDRDYLVTVLRHLSHRILEAENGHEALAVMRARVPELVVTDILMPSMDGFELIRQMRAQAETRNTPVLLFTGAYDEGKTRDLVSQCSGVTILFKPSDPELMLRTVEHILDRSPQQISQLGEDFHGAHLELITTQLHEKVTDLELANSDLIALNASLNQAVSGLRAALTEKTVLLKEVHHRVKNNLAVIAGLLNMQAQESGLEETVTALQLSQRRVRSMAIIHEQLYGSDHLDRINFADFARRLTAELYRTFVGQPKLVSVRVEAEPIELGVEQAIPCGLILNELLVNAFKYAFVEGRSGEVVVTFRQSEPGTVALTVEDNGIGIDHTLDSSKSESLGMEIIHILTQQLRGTIELEQIPRTRFELKIPLANVKSGVTTEKRLAGSATDSHSLR